MSQDSLTTNDCTMVEIASIENLPEELLIKILSYLDDPDDLFASMLISEKIHDLILGIPKFEKRLVFTVHKNYDRAFDLAIQLKSVVRCMKFKLAFDESNLVRAFLCQLPYLEELQIYKRRDYVEWNNNHDRIIEDLSGSIDLPNLKYLKIGDGLRFHLDNILYGILDVKSLEKLFIGRKCVCRNAVFDRFVFKQENLQELTILSSLLPSKNVGQFVKFNLKKLTYVRGEAGIEYLIKLLETQSESLEWLNLIGRLDNATLDLIFKEFKNLKSLKIYSQCSGIYSGFTKEPTLHRSNVPYWILPSLTYLHERGDIPVDLQNIFTKFPNLDTLKCLHLKTANGCFNTLSTFELRYFKFEQMKNLKLLNLKNLTIGHAMKIKNVEDIKAFFQNNENVENLVIKNVRDNNPQDFLDIVRNLKSIKKLKTLEMYRDYEMKFELQTVNDCLIEPNRNSSKIYRVIIDTGTKIVKISEYIATNSDCSDIRKSLEESFMEFKFIQLDNTIIEVDPEISDDEQELDDEDADYISRFKSLAKREKLN